MNYDKGISVLNASQFNYDGNAVNAITDEMAREVMDFSIEKKPCMTEDGIVIPRMNYLRRSDGGIIDALCSVGDDECAHPFYKALENSAAKLRNDKLE